MDMSVTKENVNVDSIQVYIVHGFMATPLDHWFQWLKRKLEAKNIIVEVLELPDSSSPDPVAWQKTLSRNLDGLNQNTYIVAHSLGCVSSLINLQSRLDNESIGGMILVSGFLSYLPELPQLNNFMNQKVDIRNIAKMVPKRAVIGSPQDTIVPFRLTEKLARDLDADLYSVEDAGHFLAEDGYDRFPELLSILLNMVS